jgi:O-antigen/teichoic acid export membrane protein
MSIVNIILNLIFIPKFSYKGAASITVFTEMLTLGMLYILMNRLLKIKANFSYLLKIMAPLLILSAGFYFLSRASLFNFAYFANNSLIMQLLIVISALVFGLVAFLVLLLIFKAIDKDEILEIIRTK